MYEVTVSSIILLSLDAGESQPSTAEINSPSRGTGYYPPPFPLPPPRVISIGLMEKTGRGYHSFRGWLHSRSRKRLEKIGENVTDLIDDFWNPRRLRIRRRRAILHVLSHALRFIIYVQPNVRFLLSGLSEISGIKFEDNGCY